MKRAWEVSVSSVRSCTCANYQLRPRLWMWGKRPWEREREREVRRLQQSWFKKTCIVFYNSISAGHTSLLQVYSWRRLVFPTDTVQKGKRKKSRIPRPIFGESRPFKIFYAFPNPSPYSSQTSETHLSRPWTTTTTSLFSITILYRC